MREHEADDLTTRSAVMVARAAAMPKRLVQPTNEARGQLDAAWFAKAFAAIRTASEADAALARAIDAVPITGPDALVIRTNGAQERI